MADTEKVIKLAVDAIKNRVNVPDSYSANETSEVLRQAFIDANGGSTKFDIKSLRRHPELYDIIETIIPYITVEGLQGDEFFMNLVEYRNLALGDEEWFWNEDESLFYVADVAAGTQAIMRQRLNAGTKTYLTRTWKVVKVYEELGRLLAGRIDFNMFVDRIAKSFVNEQLNDVYTVLDGITSSTTGLSSTYVQSGSFDEDTLLGIIDHVEAATGKTAQIFGTRTALRKVTTATVSDEAKSDMYNVGFYGKFNGTNMIVAKQRHVIGTSTFKLSSSKIHIIASDDKPIKVVDEGEGLLLDKDPMTNQDLSKEYLYGQKTGTGIMIAGKLGIYTIS